MRDALLMFKTGMSNNYGLSALAKTMGGRAKSGRAKSVGMSAVLFIAIVSIVVTLTTYYWLVASALQAAGRLPSLITIITLMSAVTTFMFSLYKAPGYLYASRDFDLLVSLPVRPMSILSSKMMMLYTTILAQSLLITAPGIIIFGVKTASGPLYYTAAMGLSLFLPVLPMLAGSLAAFPIVHISHKVRFPSLLTVLLYILLIVGLMVGSSVLPAASPEMIESGAQTMTGVAGYYFPAVLFTSALTERGLLEGVALTAVSAFAFALFVMLLAKSYRRINAASGERRTNARFKLRQVSVSTVGRALFKRETGFYFSTYIYVLNTGFGMVMFTLYTVAMCVFGYEYVAGIMELPEVGSELVAGVTALIGAFCIAMSLVTAPSLSLEGESLWIIKSLPVRFKDVARAKIALCLAVTAPLTLVNTTLMALFVGMGPAVYVGMTLMLLAFCAFMAVIGLVINLYFPKLDWKSPMQAVKQSASVMIAMVVGFATVALAAVPGIMFNFLGMNMTWYFYAVAAVVSVLAGLSFAFLGVKGPKMFGAL